MTQNNTLNIAPTWEQQANMLCLLMRQGNAEGIAWAKAEIVRMGQVNDELIKRLEAAEAMLGGSV